MKAILAFLAGLALAVTAHAETETTEGFIDKFNADNVGAALTKFGLKYERQKDRHGDPMLIVRESELIHENGLAVIFYGCDEANQCNTISLYTYFKSKNPLHPDIYHIWNDIFRLRTWTKIFKDSDGDTGFVLNASAVGGASVQGLEFITGKFIEEMNNFKDSLQKMPTVTVDTAASLIAEAPRRPTGSVQSPAATALTTHIVGDLGEEVKPMPKDALMRK